MLKAKKSLSQNFLIDKNISNKIVSQSKLSNKEILEIGPGYGFMTDIILQTNPKQIILVEKDYNLVKFLKEKYNNNEKIVIHCMDILKFDLNQFKNLIIISNLPYNISTKTILHLFNNSKNIYEMVLMIQKEVADKFDYNLPKMNKYKFLTKIVSTYTKCFDVSANVFIPKPKVKSSVVKFKFNKNNFDLINAIKFSKKIFKNVRKKISNNISLKKHNDLSNKRINELSIDELLEIYNLF